MPASQRPAQRWSLAGRRVLFLVPVQKNFLLMDVISDTPLAVAEGNTDYTFLGIERRLGRLALRQFAESSPVIGEEEAFAPEFYFLDDCSSSSPCF